MDVIKKFIDTQKLKLIAKCQKNCRKKIDIPSFQSFQESKGTLHQILNIFFWFLSLQSLRLFKVRSSLCILHGFICNATVKKYTYFTLVPCAHIFLIARNLWNWINASFKNFCFILICVWKFEEQLRKNKYLESTMKDLQKMYSRTKVQEISLNSCVKEV